MNEFLNMGGYAAYVWGSFGAALLVYGWIWWSPRAARHACLRDLEDAA